MLTLCSGVAMPTRLRHCDDYDVDRHVADEGADQLNTASH